MNSPALTTFFSRCRDLVAKEAAEAERRKEERRRKERKNRDAFTALLRAHLADGRLSCKTRFKVQLCPGSWSTPSFSSCSILSNLFGQVSLQYVSLPRHLGKCAQQSCVSRTSPQLVSHVMAHSHTFQA